MTARKAPRSPSASASHPRPSLLNAVQKPRGSVAPITAPIVSNPTPVREVRRGSPRRRQATQHGVVSHTRASKDPAPILVEKNAGPSELETQLLASLERDAKRKGTTAEPVPRPSPHVYFGEEGHEDGPAERVYPYEIRRPPHAEALPVLNTQPASTLRPLHVSLGVTWEWHASPVWPKTPDASLARLGDMAHECVYDALLYQLNSVDRPAEYRRPWTVARSVLLWMPQSLLWWLYRHLPSPSSVHSQHTPHYPVWIVPMDAPQRMCQWHLATLTLPIMLLSRTDAFVAALLELLFVMIQLVLSVVAWGR